MFDKLSDEIIRKILNKLNIYYLKKISIVNKEINNLNYKYFLVPYKILYKFFNYRIIKPKYIYDEIKDWIDLFNYRKSEYIKDLAYTLDDLKIKKKFLYKNIIPLDYNMTKYKLNRNRKTKYTKVHYIYDNIPISIYFKIKKNNPNLIGLL